MSFELAWPQRSHRVRFKRPVRVVPLVDGPPRAFRVLSGNLSKQGIYLSMPEPFAEGTKLALSLEAGGRVLPFAQGEVVWRQGAETLLHTPLKPGGGAGLGVRFTGFLHPRAHELIDYLVRNLDTGRPLQLPKPRRWKRALKWTGGIAASVALAALGVMLGRNVTLEPPAPIEQPSIAEVAPPAPPAPSQEPVPVMEAKPAEPELAPLPEAPAPAPVMAAAEALAAKPEAPVPLSSAGLLPLPRCAASSLKWSQRGSRTDLDVAPVAGGKVVAAFRMKNPERLVVDLSGMSPKRSFVVKASEIPNVSGLRIGKRKGGGTRLVLDLTRPAGLKVEGSRVSLTY
jgi:hypothetical protein